MEVEALRALTMLRTEPDLSLAWIGGNNSGRERTPAAKGQNSRRDWFTVNTTLRNWNQRRGELEAKKPTSARSHSKWETENPSWAS